MSTEREYEAGTDLDPEAAAFVEREAAGDGDAPPPAKKERVREPDFDVSAPKDEAKPDPDEERAARMGWAPKDQWRGNPDKWVDAKTFVERANPAILLERMDKMAKDHETTVQRLERMNEAALQKQQSEFQSKIADMQRQRDEAMMRKAAEGDLNGARKVGEQWNQHINETIEKRQSAEPPEVVSARDAWLAKRPFKTDKRFAAAAYAELDSVQAEMPNATPEQQFAELDRRLASDFPRIYGAEQQAQSKPAANGAPPPDSRQMDGVRIAGKKSTNYAGRLPAAAKAQGERFVKQGAYKDIESYAKEYFADE